MSMQIHRGRCVAPCDLQPWCQTGLGCQHRAPAALALQKTQYKIHRRLGGPQSWSVQQ
jgi:hypothetical protein